MILKLDTASMVNSKFIPDYIIPKKESLDYDRDYHDIVSGKKPITGSSVILDCSQPTRNRVLYPPEEMQKAINDPRVIELLERKELRGEVEHPVVKDKDGNLDLDVWTTFNESKTAFIWTKLWMEGSTLWGSFQTTSENGNKLAVRILEGAIPAFSIRVLGKPKQEKGYEVMRDIYFITADYVSYPGGRNSVVANREVFEAVNLDTIFSNQKNGTNIVRAESAAITDYIGTGKQVASINENYIAVRDNLTSKESMDMLRLKESLCIL